VERWDGESAVVATGQAARPDDKLMLQFNSQTGEVKLYEARVVSCDIDPRHGSPRFRLHLYLTGEADRPGTSLDSYARLQQRPAKK
jgi:hypothetical protein